MFGTTYVVGFVAICTIVVDVVIRDGTRVMVELFLFGRVSHLQYVCRFCRLTFGFEATCLRCHEQGWFVVRGFDSRKW